MHTWLRCHSITCIKCYFCFHKLFPVLNWGIAYAPESGRDSSVCKSSTSHAWGPMFESQWGLDSDHTNRWMRGEKITSCKSNIALVSLTDLCTMIFFIKTKHTKNNIQITNSGTTRISILNTTCCSHKHKCMHTCIGCHSTTCIKCYFCISPAISSFESRHCTYVYMWLTWPSCDHFWRV